MRTTAIGVCVLLLSAPVLRGQESWAVVIGVNYNRDYGELDTPVNDARAIAEVLGGSGGFQHIILLTDDAAEPFNRPTLAAIQKRIEDTARIAEAEDTLVVFFSGHGDVRDGVGYLIPIDGDRRHAVSLDWVRDILAKSRAHRKMLILDSCHAGSGSVKGVSGIAGSLSAQASGLVLLLSSGADQFSYPDEASGRSVFTRFLVEALSGSADSNNDRAVSCAEAFLHIKTELKQWYVETGRLQMPVLYPDSPPDFILTSHLTRSAPAVQTVSADARDTGAPQERGERAGMADAWARAMQGTGRPAAPSPPASSGRPAAQKAPLTPERRKMAQAWSRSIKSKR